MATADAAEAIALFKANLEGAVDAAGLDSANASRLESKLLSNGIINLGGVAHYEHGGLRNASTRGPTLVQLEALILVAAGSRAPDATAVLSQTLAELADRCVSSYDRIVSDRAKPVDATAAAATNKADLGRKCYDDLHRFHNKVVVLGDKLDLSKVGDMRAEILKTGYLTQVPSVGNPGYASRVGTLSQMGLGSMADGSTASIQVSSVSGTMARMIETVQHNLRSVLYAVLAAFSRPIRLDAFGGGVAGVILMPGENKTVRLQLCLDSVERFIWRLAKCGNNYTDDATADYILLCDNVLYEFLQICEKRAMHPSDILTYMIDQTPRIFKPRAADDVSSSGGAPESNKSDATPPGASRGVCSNWLQNGQCRKYQDGQCGAEHPNNAQGALHGNGRRIEYGTPYKQQRPQGNSSWNNQGGWGNNHNQWNGGGWNNQSDGSWPNGSYGKWPPKDKGGGKGGGKGKGKGKGGKGKGKGKWW